jgi:hypothetical protein
LLDTKSQSNSIWCVGGIRAFPKDKEWTQSQNENMFTGARSHHRQDIVNKLSNLIKVYQKILAIDNSQASPALQTAHIGMKILLPYLRQE